MGATPQSRSGKRKRKDDDPDYEENEGQKKGYYTIFDVEMLHELIQRDMWIISKSPPTAFGRRLAITYLCAGWALSGGDFCQVQGLRADVILDTVPAIMHRHPHILAKMSAAWENNREKAFEMVKALVMLLGKSATWMETENCTLESVGNVRHAAEKEDVELYKAAWTICYWSGQEYVENLSEFGIE